MTNQQSGGMSGLVNNNLPPIYTQPFARSEFAERECAHHHLTCLHLFLHAVVFSSLAPKPRNQTVFCISFFARTGAPGGLARGAHKTGGNVFGYQSVTPTLLFWTTIGAIQGRNSDFLRDKYAAQP